MLERLSQLEASAQADLERATTQDAVEAARVKYLGKKGELSAVLAGLGKLAPEERRKLGEVANTTKASLEELFRSATGRVEALALARELEGPRLDVTLPGRDVRVGHRHPVSRTLEDLVAIFARLGFTVEEGPEIELDWFNFEALNLPPDHPARDMQDTFYVTPASAGVHLAEGQVVLRTHTSPVQIRAMLGRPWPLRSIMPGRVYRRDSDQTHTPMFHQIEGLYVDRGVSMAELKGTLTAFAQALFGPTARTRFRPSFFPFTEPSAEVDISCSFCGGAGCRVCKGTGWLEVLGSGMVHPQVLRNGGYDPAEVQGFAFGLGVERLAMLRHGIDDLRTMFDNDVRFLAQF